MRNRRTAFAFITVATLLLGLLTTQAASAAWNGGHDVVGCPEAKRTWYFAEGTTRAGFTEYVCLLNPGTAATVATVTYMLDSGENVEKAYSLPPSSRTTVSVGADVPPERDVSVKVSAPDLIVAERPMYFTYGGAWSGGHDIAGIGAPGVEWYFAEGCSRPGFDTYLCLQNPNETAAILDISYFCADGQVVKKEGVRVEARSRLTVPAHEDALGVGRHDGARGDFSIKVESANGVPVVAERPMYFSYGGAITGGHDAAGAPEPAREWQFAEGCTRPGFDTYLCLSNPQGVHARVNISYFCADGQVVKKEGVRVDARSRLTVPVHEDALGVGRHDNAHGDFSIRVESANGVPVVAERPMYFSYRPSWTGGHDVIGATAPSETWLFAEGCTRPGFNTYLCLSNPGDRDAALDITYYCGDGQVVAKPGIAVLARSRLTVPVHEDAMGVGRHDNAHGDFAIKVESRNGVAVVAERPVYFAEKWRTYDRAALAAARGWGEVARGNTSRMMIALTFDMESSGATANAMMDVLKQRGVGATFFILSSFASYYPQALTRMANEGHEIANHSVSHSQWTKRGPSGLAGELAAVESRVNGVTGFSTKPYFRFPYGDRNASLIQAANAAGYLSVYWSIDPQEWRSGSTASSIVSTVLSQASPGGIMLMHDKSVTPAALPGIIDGLRARGYTLVTLTELLAP